MIDLEKLKQQDIPTYNELFVDNSYDVQDEDIKGKNVLDIGGNIGLFAILSHLKGAKNIVSVEAQPTIYKQLLQNISGISNITPLNYAVFSEDNKIVKMKNLNASSRISEDEGEEVETITLKSLMKYLPEDDNDMVLKIDVEGAEYDILLTADPNDIDRFGILYVEIHAGPAFHAQDIYNPNYRGMDILMDRIKSFGFTERNRLQIWIWDNVVDGKRINERPAPITVHKFTRGPQRDRIVCCLPTKNRYGSTLPMAIQSIIMQTRKPDKLIIYDDGEGKDLRNESIYQYLFDTLDAVGIKWEVIITGNVGQHHAHQHSNWLGFDYVWRIDDDEVASPDVLEKLLSHMTNGVGAVAGSVILPNAATLSDSSAYAKHIQDIDKLPNIQWFKGNKVEEVEHLYSSFLYRAGIASFNMDLSPVAHREETLFTHELFEKGYKLIVDLSAVTYHYRNSKGGIREGHQDMFTHDELIFRRKMREWGYLYITLLCGLGDCFAFLNILPKLKEKFKYIRVENWTPQVFEGVEGIDAMPIQNKDLADYEHIYKWAVEHQWNGHLIDAFEKRYVEGVE